MAPLTDNDLKELKDLINLKFDKVDSRFEKIDSQFEKMNNELTNLTIDVATIKVNLNNIEKKLEEGQSVLTKRIDGLDTRLNTLIAVAFTGLLGIIAKLVFLK